MAQQTLPFPVANEPETTNTEFKSASGGRLPEDTWKSISAFSNTDGGKIVLGVSPSGRPLNLSRDAIDKLQLDLTSLCSQFFNCAIIPELVVSEGILIAHIPAISAALRPVYSKRHGVHKGAYVRIGSSNILVNDEWLRRFSVAAKGGAEGIEYPGHYYSEYFDLRQVGMFINHLNERRGNIYQSFTQQEVLHKQKAVNKKGEVTLFGLLAFGNDYAAQEVIAPTVNIGITQYPGSTKVNENDLTETYLDNREFYGNAVEQFERAFAFIKTKLPIRGTIDQTGKRRDYFIIPEIALREALANAIAHRDYAVYSSRIQIDVYSDRLEIINPGVSLVPINELDTAPSATRNPLLMSYLKEYGITDQKARGIRTIKLSLKKAGLLEPGFENISQSFKVTLFASAFISNQDKEWLMQFAPLKLNERQQNALAHAHNNPNGINNSEYRNINSMSNVRDDKKANKELKQLVVLGVMLPVGDNRARRYVINQMSQ